MSFLNCLRQCFFSFESHEASAYSALTPNEREYETTEKTPEQTAKTIEQKSQGWFSWIGTLFTRKKTTALSIENPDVPKASLMKKHDPVKVQPEESSEVYRPDMDASRENSAAATLGQLIQNAPRVGKQPKKPLKARVGEMFNRLKPKKKPKVDVTGDKFAKEPQIVVWGNQGEGFENIKVAAPYCRKQPNLLPKRSENPEFLNNSVLCNEALQDDDAVSYFAEDYSHLDIQALGGMESEEENSKLERLN